MMKITQFCVEKLQILMIQTFNKARFNASRVKAVARYHLLSATLAHFPGMYLQSIRVVSAAHHALFTYLSKHRYIKPKFSKAFSSIVVNQGLAS
jgi:hypothetical protein